MKNDFNLLDEIIKKNKIDQDVASLVKAYFAGTTIDDPKLNEHLKNLKEALDIKIKVEGENDYEDYRTMIILISKSYKVLISLLVIKLYEMRLHKKENLPNKKQMGEVTLNFYVPLAHRLGLGTIKGELEELSLYYIDYDKYMRVANFLSSKKNEREKLLNQHIKDIDNLLKGNIQGYEVNGRNKNIYSIYKKTLSVHRDFEQIYDFQGIRIICQNKEDCYYALGAIHENFTPIPNRFKDYIALKKPNLYQSLHTTVTDSSGHIFEVQIRTYEMHEIAERGVAAHWSYKEGNTSQNDVEEQLHLFRDIIEDHNDQIEKDVNQEIFESTIYTFTPNNKIIMLPTGATVIDFAYKVHTKVGENMVGAIVNEKIATFDTVLKNGDRVQIKTKEGASAPQKEWLNIVKTKHAQRKIKSFINKEMQHLDNDSLNEARTKVKKAINSGALRYDILGDEKIQKKVVNALNLKDLNALLKEMDEDKLHISDIDRVEFDDELRIKTKELKSGFKDIDVASIGNIKTHLSKCCNPVYGDDIVGTISNGKYIAIHRKDCNNVKDSNTIELNWKDTNSEKYSTILNVFAINRSSLMNDIINTLAKQKIDLGDIKSKVDEEIVKTRLQVYVKNKEEVEQLINSLKNIKNIQDVKRV